MLACNLRPPVAAAPPRSSATSLACILTPPLFVFSPLFFFFWCEFAGAFTTAETALFSGVGTEGAEQGMDMIWAAKALEIVRTTCNRAIYVLMEAPAYGYSTGTQAKWVMAKSSSFYDGSECPCASHTVGGVTTNECRNTALYPVTISNRGWLPGSAYPVETGADGVAYSADSTATTSPWFESMVFPRTRRAASRRASSR